MLRSGTVWLLALTSIGLASGCCSGPSRWNLFSRFRSQPAECCPMEYEGLPLNGMHGQLVPGPMPMGPMPQPQLIPPTATAPPETLLPQPRPAGPQAAPMPAGPSANPARNAREVKATDRF